MIAEKIISRKAFLKSLLWFSLIPLFLLIREMIRKNKEFGSDSGTIEIQKEIAEGISFKNDLIIIKKGIELTFFSSRCTHLGCRINKAENDVLVCPCHGSRFNLLGANISGPASESLTKLMYSQDETKNCYIIKLK